MLRNLSGFNPKSEWPCRQAACCISEVFTSPGMPSPRRTAEVGGSFALTLLGQPRSVKWGVFAVGTVSYLAYLKP